MRLELAVIGLLLLAWPARAQDAPQTLPLPQGPGEQTLEFGAASLTIAMPAPESHDPIRITATSPDTEPVTLSLDHDPDVHEFPPDISVVEMDASNTTPEFMIQRYSGGAHCCGVVQILDLVAGEWRIVQAGSWDGGGISPEDADGDGEYELVHGDDRFLYRFSCYACAGTPIRIFKLIEGALADVTMSPLFRPRDEKDLPNFKEGCANHDNGACAAYVAVASRLGKHDEAWRFMLDHYNRDSDWGLSECAAYADGKCVAPVRYPSYPDALAAFLARINAARPGMP